MVLAGVKLFWQCTRRFGGVPDDFGGVPNDFGEVPNNFGDVPNNFGEVPNNFGEVPNDFDAVPNVIDKVRVADDVYGEFPHSKSYFRKLGKFCYLLARYNARGYIELMG